jgi:hypothetical protein
MKGSGKVPITKNKNPYLRNKNITLNMFPIFLPFKYVLFIIGADPS